MSTYVSSVSSLPKEENPVTLIAINGEKTADLKLAVARKSKNKDNTSFYVRTEGLAPIHHERFKTSALINPTLNKVDEETYNVYMNYLNTKKEVFYNQVRALMKTRGFI